MSSSRKKTGYLGDHELNKDLPRSTLQKFVSRMTHKFTNLKQFEKMSVDEIRSLNPDSNSTDLNKQIADNRNKLLPMKTKALMDLLEFKRERNVMSAAMKSDGKSKDYIASYRSKSVVARRKATKGGKSRKRKKKRNV